MSNLNLKQEERVFKVFFEKYYSALCIYCRRFFDDDDVIEDLVQDSFVALWIKRVDLSCDDELLFYLKCMVKNRALNYLKRLKIKEKFILESQYHEQLCEDTPEELILRDEIKEKIAGLFGELPEIYKSIYVASFLDDHSDKELSEKLQISTRTIGRYKKQIKEYFKTHLKV